jgi:FkbM family methyltransferase
MTLRLWGMRAAKAFAAFSAAARYRRHGHAFASPVLVDIGARGGLQRKWLAYRKLAPLRVILIEADPDEANSLQRRNPDASIVATALGEEDGVATLFITSDPGCSSLLKPTAEAQAIPDLGYRLKIERSASLTLQRADDVFARQALPQPDFLKIDTQGTELAILKGFGVLLDGVVGLEIECELHPIYEGQPLLTEICDWLRLRGFALEALRPNGLYEHGIIDSNAFFVRRSASLDRRQKVLADLWRRVNRIPSHHSYVIASG